MELHSQQLKSISVEMATDDYYRKVAKGYRCSEEYDKMINLYPVLQSTINECKNENLIK
tara:strand:+ start:700 stop:876 length:177 start_codon:yes stop_codon:yes gene_type:complete